MSSNNGHFDDQLDAYLDGLVDDVERAAIEVRLAAEPRLRAALETQRAVDGSLQRQFMPPPNERLEPLVRAAATRADHDTSEHDDVIGVVGKTPAPRPRRWLAAAAAIMLAVTGAWMAWRALAPAPSSPYVRQAFRTMATVYDDVVAAELVPDVVCRDDEEFANWFRRPFGQGLQLAELPPGAVALGLGYANTISPWTVYVILEVDGKPVVLFVDLLAHDRSRPLPEESDLHRFRMELGDLVLYELTPFPEARVLPAAVDPDAGYDASGS